jgi:exodeoxyribonuclease VII small subunit
MNFSEEFEKLEKIVTKLEREKLSLEESLSLYEEGVAKTKLLQKYLDEAEQKISRLAGNGNEESFEQ